MLDVETVTAPVLDGLDIVPLASMKKHLRINNTAQDEEIQDAVREAAAALDGPDGILNRAIFPRTMVRYLHAFPRCRHIELPCPPLRDIVSIQYFATAGVSPTPTLDLADLIVRRPDGATVGSVELVSGKYWPQTITHQRAVAITYTCGFEAGHPLNLIRLIKILAADFLANKEASINDRMQLLTSKKTAYGVDFLLSSLRVPAAVGGWD